MQTTQNGKEWASGNPMYATDRQTDANTYTYFIDNSALRVKYVDR